MRNKRAYCGLFNFEAFSLQLYQIALELVMIGTSTRHKLRENEISLVYNQVKFTIICLAGLDGTGKQEFTNLSLA